MTTDLESVNAEVAFLREREAAMREILSLISASRTDPTPVFKTIIKSAAQLSDAPSANLVVLNEARSHWTLEAHYGAGLRHLKVGQTTRFSDSNLVPAQSMRAASIVEVEDLVDTDLYRQGDPGWVAMVELEGMRTIVGVPIIINREAIGCITLFRREVKAFTADEIELVETFAAQAAIAIENVRQFREIQTRLERERASAEVLEVISTSRDDDAPVFDAILKRASALCRTSYAGLALINEAGTHLVYTASHGPPLAHSQVGDMQWALDGETSFAEAVRSKCPVQIEDMKKSALYVAGDPQRVAHVDQDGIRTFLAVPMFQNGEVIGAFGLARFEVSPFSQDDIDLVETFAAQAVIAIENVRQFKEIQTRLEREAATGEVLSVISQSRSDAQPVFSAILENASRLCSAPHAILLLRDQNDEHLVVAANNAAQSAFIDHLRKTPHRLDNEASYAVRAVKEKRVLHIPDLSEAKSLSEHVPQIKVALDLEGMRTVLQVPLHQGNKAIGVIALYKLEVAPFTDDQIKLVETFAAQAVIAIENTNQFRNLEALNAELGKRVDQKVEEIERMGRLKRFLPSAVADAVVTSGDESLLTSHRALVATLFCDLRGFTAFCESAEPEETIEVLQTYHQEMSILIDEYGGGVDQRAGDGIMVIFNDPITVDDPAGDAVRLAVAMRRKMRELCAGWKKLGHRLGFGIGISYGYATVGIVGSEGRFDYTASGTSINTAARLCDMAENDEILISPRTWAAIEGELEAESRGEAKIKGIREPVEVFAVVTDSFGGKKI